MNFAIFFNTILMAILVSVVTISQSCSRPKASQVDYEKFVVPEFQNESFPINLASDESVKRFSGSVMIWNNSLNRDSAYEFMSASKRSVDLEVERLIYIRDVLMPTAKKLEETKTTKEELVNNAALSLRKQSLEQAVIFKDQTLSNFQAVQALSDDSNKYFNTAFAVYCDALLFNRAANPQFLAQNYAKRPIWSGVCESYYAASGLLDASVPVCKDQPQGSNYFSCLWSEGVLKTSLFKSLYSTETQQIIASISSDLIGSKYNFNKLGLNNFLSLMKSYKLRNESGEVIAEIPAPDVKQAEDELVLYRKIRGNKGVFALISDYERGKISTLDYSLQEFTSEQISKLDSLASAFRKVVAANSDRGGALRSSEQLYNDFYILKDKMEKNEVTIEKTLVKDYEEVVSIAPILFNPQFDASIDVKIKEVDAELSELLQDGKKILDQINAGTKCEIEFSIESGFIGCRVEAALKKQLDVGSKKEISDALINGVQFRVEKDEKESREDVRNFSFSFSKSALDSLSVCYNTKNNRRVDCARKDGAKNYEVYDFEMDASNGRVRLVVKILNSAALSLGYKARESNSTYNEINYDAVPMNDDLDQIFLEVEIFPNRLENMHDIYSGSVKIKRNPTDEDYLSYGNISLRDENPEFQDIKTKFESIIENASLQ